MRIHHLLIAVSLVMACAAPAAAEMDDKAFKKAKKRATTSLKGGNPTAAAAAITELAEDDSARAVKFFLSMAKVPDHSVYSALRDGLAVMDSEEAKASMLKPMGKGNPLTQLLIIDAMEKRADEFIEKVLTKAMSAKQGEIQRAAIAVVSRKQVRPVCGAMIELLKRLEKKDGDGLNANLIRKALQDMTKESFATAEDWGNYWASNTKANPENAGSSGGGTKRRKRPTFYGSEILSKRVVFVIDTSLSMHQDQLRKQGGRVVGKGGPKHAPAPADSRIERAKAQLPKGSLFGIISYSAPKAMVVNGKSQLPNDGSAFPRELNGFAWLKVWKERLAPANKKSVASAKGFVSELFADGATYTLRGIEAAFEIPDADTIVVLSDGQPNDIDAKTHQPMNVDEILAAVKKLNRKRRMVINTFGIFPKLKKGERMAGKLAKFLEDLAAQNGGKFTPVTK